jgi:hypothetical protein
MLMFGAGYVSKYYNMTSDKENHLSNLNRSTRPVYVIVICNKRYTYATTCKDMIRGMHISEPKIFQSLIKTSINIIKCISGLNITMSDQININQLLQRIASEYCQYIINTPDVAITSNIHSMLFAVSLFFE